ncbi:hypothetical protein [Desertivirga brevis]|uniref:hypothetical protein n=1 Tax=Desertivirga brevis TaxID=2810310 RepID=UPI001A97240E|nr:hypothetical protein [Pedobacter sp. SYSU D00873]
MSKPYKSQMLLSKYQSISFDTLEVQSVIELESNTNKFKGTRLDSSEVLLLRSHINEQYYDGEGYFACNKFPIDKNRTALITRAPSTYNSSAIKLFVFNKEKNVSTCVLELADVFGDAGDSSEKITWLFKDKNKGYKAFSWYTESHDNSLDDENDTTVDTSNFYYLIDLSKPNLDTLSTDEARLLKRFGSLFNQR